MSKQETYDTFLAVKKRCPHLSPQAIIERYKLDMSVPTAYTLLKAHEVETGERFGNVSVSKRELKLQEQNNILKSEIKAKNKKIRQLEEEPTMLRLEITKLKVQHNRLRKIVNGYIRDQGE